MERHILKIFTNEIVMNDDMLQLIEDEKRSMMHMESFYDNRFHQHNL